MTRICTCKLLLFVFPLFGGSAAFWEGKGRAAASVRSKTVLFLLLSLPISAQKIYTLEECVNRALSHHPDIMLQNLNLLRAQNTIEQAQKNRLPNVSASVSSGLNGGRSIDPFSNSFVQRTVSYNSLGLSGNLNLFNGFALKNQILQSKVNAEAEQNQLELVKKELKFAVIEAFMNVVVNQQLVILQKENERDILSQMESVTERIKEGVLASYNRTETEAQLASTRFELISFQNSLKLSKMVLGHFMMLKGDFELILPEISEPKLNFQKPVFSFHPAFRVAEKRIISARYGIDIAKADKLPRISLNAGIGTSYSSFAAEEFSYFRQLGHNFNQYLGLSLSVPIYTNVKPRIEAARIEEKIARKQREKQELQLSQQSETLSLEVSTLKEKLKSSSVNVASQSALYEGAKEKYKEGLINNLELNTYRLNLEKARVQHIQTETEHYFKSEVLKAFYE
jgi:outer membrane protein